jgi:putative restriction endonuclease
MPSFSDDEVRAAALAKVRQLRDAYGGRVPRVALMEGIVLHGERIPLWNHQKGIFKPRALGPNGAALSIQTSIASPYNDVHDAGEGRIHYKYQGSDPDHHDNVALRRAWERQLPLIYLVAVDPGYYDVIAPIFISEDVPGALEFTLQADQSAWLTHSDNEVMTAARREYATRAVLQRLHQQQFRRMVLSAYREQCAICRLRRVELLDAAHILADRHPKGEPIVTNGLGLCKIHHSAYDVDIIGIDPDAGVHVREDVLREVDGPMLKHGLQEVAGSRLILPRKAELKPNRDFLAERFDRFRAA